MCNEGMMTFTKFENVTSPSSLESITFYFSKCCSFELIDKIDSFKGYSTMGDEHGVSTTCQPKEIKIKNNIKKMKNQIEIKMWKIKKKTKLQQNLIFKHSKYVFPMSVLMNHTPFFKVFNLGFGVRKTSKEMN